MVHVFIFFFLQVSNKRINQPTPFNSPTLIKKNELTIGIKYQEYLERRCKLFDKMVDNSVLIIVASPQLFMSTDIVYKYRQDPSFHYITGFLEPNTVCVLQKINNVETNYILFVTEIIEKDLTHTGYLTGTSACKEIFAPDTAYKIDKLSSHLKPILRSCDTIYCDFPEFDKNKFLKNANNSIPMVDLNLYYQIYHLYETLPKRNKPVLKECKPMIEELRLIKSESEIELMKQSSKVAALSMCEVIQSATPNTLEDRLASLFEFGCRMRGADRLSAPVTISNGNDNNILHYLNNDQTIKNGCLCLLDSGAELYGYCSDITRVFPVNGKFTQAQLDVYYAVWNVQKKCINQCCKPGYTIDKLDKKSIEFLIDEMKKLGIDYQFVETGKSKTNKKRSKNNSVNMEMWHSGGVHYVSHWIGMDIHDTPSKDHQTQFQPGMCIALEPGIYLPNHPSIPEKYRNIGVRIEDTLLITQNGCQVLTSYAPKDPKRIEKLMKMQKDRKIWKNAQSGRLNNDDIDDDHDDNYDQCQTSPIDAAAKAVRRTLFHISNLGFV